MTEPVGPSFVTVLDWMEGRLDAPAAAVVAAAARTDPRVRDIVVWLTAFRGVTTELPLMEPPPVVTQRLQVLFRRRLVGLGPEDPTPVVASLLVDSRRDVVAAGVRDGGADDPDGVIRLAYTCDVADVVLDVRRGADATVAIDGQVLLLDPASAAKAFLVKAALPGAAPVRSVHGDRCGRFRLRGVSEHASSLRLDSGEVALVVPLDLRAPHS